jgi:hypothetical protein
MATSKKDITSEIIERINDEIGKNPEISRTELSRIVCEWLEWKSENGKLQEVSCRKHLNELDRRGKIKLPIQTRVWHFQKKAAIDIGAELPSHFQISCSLGELGEIEIIRITGGTKHSRIWNHFMETYHYLKSARLAGAQVRYLIRSSLFGWLGGFSFSACALKTKKRDDYIGWSDEARAKNINLVINNSRFLILPNVKVENLASHLLSLFQKRITQDWLKLYHFAPVAIETFVERERYQATCYRAANWIYLGKTSGRGRNDTEHHHGEALKDIYFMPLCDDWKNILCTQADGTLSKPKKESVSETTGWAEHELAEVSLGDKRLNIRLVKLLSDFYNNPQASIQVACGGTAAAFAAYRFLGNDRIKVDDILNSHREATIDRIKDYDVVLAAQDTTFVNLTSMKKTKGLGPINNKGDKTKGVVIHDTVAFSESGVPLGIVDFELWARPDTVEKIESRKNRPIEEKESYKWIKSYRMTSSMQLRCPNSTIISVGDRENDVYEYFLEASQIDSGAKLLVRSSGPTQRKIQIDDGKYDCLWSSMQSKEVVAQTEVRIVAQNGCPARLAKVNIRFSRITLKTPKKNKSLDLNMWAVYALEDVEPKEGTRLEWMLLTTVEIKNSDDAKRALRWYGTRWGIEVFHKVMKSGCGIESRQLNDLSKLHRCFALDMIVAWRLLYMTTKGRECPSLPCSTMIDEIEWKALTSYFNQSPKPAENPPTLAESARMIAELGGFLGRPHDGEPGSETMWRGLSVLSTITQSWLRFSPYAKSYLIN